MKLVGIGAVSEASGIPIDTLRTWERRYGFPAPQRTNGGQRLYGPETIDRLLAVKGAMANGLQVSRAVEMVTLEAEFSEAPHPRARREVVPPRPGQSWLERWLFFVTRLDGDSLDQIFRRDHGLLGTMGFLNERAGPFLDAVGEAWADGRLTVANEHFASERFREFLAGIWWPIAAENNGPTVVCATMPGEHHQLGLQMAAATLALAGLRVVFLGENMPPQDTALAAQMTTAAAVVISVSRAMEPPTVRRQLHELRVALGHRIEIVIGGAGAPAADSAAIAPGSLNNLAAWAENLFKT